MTILICGEALFDVFFEAERPDGFTLDARIGGSAFNVAIGLGRLAQPVGLLTGVARDRLGDKLAATLAAEGVDPAYLRRKDATTTLGLVSLDEAGSAQYNFYGEGAADRMVLIDDLPDTGPIAAASFGCFSLLTQPTGDSFLTFAERLASAGHLVVLDPNIRPTVEPDPAVWRRRVDAFAAHAGLIKVSAEDLEHLYPGEAVADVAARWLAGEAGAVVVTHGGDGVEMIRAGGTLRVPARSVRVADTVGAGDSFLAAFLMHLRETGALSRDAIATLSDDAAGATLAFAANAAAITCERRGADLPRRSELPAI